MKKTKDTYKKNNLRHDTLQEILSKISKEALAQTIGLKIDLARVSYRMDQVIIESFEEFSETVLSYYIHMLKQLNRIKIPVDFNVLNAEAFALINKAFSNNGGFKFAIEESRTGVWGGMRYILDRITDQLKKEEQEKIIDLVLKFSFDPLEWDIKVLLIKDLIQVLKPALPPEIYSQPPEKFANNYEILIRSYVNSMDQLKHTFQTI